MRTWEDIEGAWGHRSSAAKHGERLAPKQAEDTSGQQVAKEGLHDALVMGLQLQAAPMHLQAVGDIAKEATKRDGLCHRGQVDVEDGGEGLHMDGIGEIRGVPWQLPLDVLDQSPKESPCKLERLILFFFFLMVIQWRLLILIFIHFHGHSPAPLLHYHPVGHPGLECLCGLRWLQPDAWVPRVGGQDGQLFHVGGDPRQQGAGAGRHVGRLLAEQGVREESAEGPALVEEGGTGAGRSQKQR